MDVRNKKGMDVWMLR